MLNRRKGKLLIAAAAAVLLIWISAGQDLKTAPTPFKTAVRTSLSSMFAEKMYGYFLPRAAWIYEGGAQERFMVRRAEGMLPLYGMARRGMADGENRMNREPVAGEDDRHSVFLEYEELEQTDTEPEIQDAGLREDGAEREQDIQALLLEENEAAMAAADVFVPHPKKMQVDLEELKDYETLVRTFYTIDANTSVGSDRLNVDSLLARDMTVSKSGEEPQILIYHTHSQEAFADSAAGDANTTVVGVGERLAEILRTEYGYCVLHDTGQFDVDGRDDAYGRALPELERILEENPSIEVVIDLHRDQMPEDTRLVMDLDGRPTARFMFFNGLSRTRKTGDISYLQNENLTDNLAFSFQMQLKAQEYYPGLTRKIYLKAYRYNLHLRPKSMLVELGAQNNTVEEAMNACGPLAHLLDMVLSGEE